MKMIYGTADPKLVMVEVAPEEVRLIYRGGNPEILFHREIVDRTRNAFDAAGVCGEDVIAYDLDMTDAERNTVLATAAHYSPVSVRRAKAPNRKIWRKSHIALNGL